MLLSPQLFSLVSSLVEERSGLNYGTGDVSLFSDKVAARMAEAGFESALDYYYYLRYDPAGEAETASLIDALVVGETYLFRELDGLNASITEVIEPAIAERGRARVWSAGCSTGEEPFSLAMLLAERGLLEKVEILATDVSHRSLARARSGYLGVRSLRLLTATPATPVQAKLRALADRFIQTDRAGVARIGSEIVSAPTFFRESLLDTPSADRGGLDLIFCRNVLIYFRDELVRQVTGMLADQLRPGGRLIVGASESLLRFGTFLRCEERGGAFFYIKGSK